MPRAGLWKWEVTVRPKLFFLVAIATAAVLALSACVYSSNDIQVGQGQSISGPSASPSPDPQCALRSLDLGTAGDATTIAQDAAVGLVLTAYGAQGLELSSACLATLSPSWAVSGPCLLEGGGWAPSLRAPTGTPLGASCAARADAGGVRSNEARLTVAP